jgi:hypothetical protein
MAEVKMKRIVVPDASVATMANRFTKYKPEEEKAVRKGEVVEDETLKRLKGAWRKVIIPEEESTPAEKIYEMIENALRGVEYTAKDVETFSILLADFQGENDSSSNAGPFLGESRFLSKAGLFLSALINNGTERKYTLNTAHLEIPLSHIGFRNTKAIDVIGDVGYVCGEEMESGWIFVTGNAGVGLGQSMKGGTITVCGDAWHGVGASMEDGTIEVGGSMGSIGYHIRQGSIYHRGKLVLCKSASEGYGWND